MLYNDYIKVKKSEHDYAALNVTAYIGLGGNLGDVTKAINVAVQSLRNEPDIATVNVSPVYRTAPIGGPSGQPEFLNAVARIETSLSPAQLLACCLKIEQQLGRVRMEHHGPRTIDLDVLLYGDREVAAPGLMVPHPRLRQRLFALAPLHDVAPDNLLLPPDGMPLSDVIAEAMVDAGVSMDWLKENRTIS